MTWQSQLDGVRDTSVDVDVYDLDLEDTPKETIAVLHADGRRVICDFSAGSYENWRSDTGKFPASVLGRPLDGWPGERWLDDRSPVVREIMSARMDAAVAKECDAVEPDKVDGYANRPGFPPIAADQLDDNRFLAREAHARCLAVGLKYDVEQIPALIDDVDFAVNEQCYRYRECAAVAAFVAAGKPVFRIEYALRGKATAAKANAVCPRAEQLGFATLIKRLSLGSYRVDCERWMAR